MKKFISTIPRQLPEYLIDGIYFAGDNEKLFSRTPTCFPVVSMIETYAGAGEEICVVSLVAEYQNCRNNLLRLKHGVTAVCGVNGIKVEFIDIYIPFNERLDTHLVTFEKLISLINDDDMLYVCITYGTKPTPVLEMMALHYAYQAKRNVSVGCVAYGEMDHMTKEKKIYDVTALIYLDEIVNSIAKLRPTDPLSVIRKILLSGKDMHINGNEGK